MNFSNPIWLYAMFGLAIPVLIHLWSKREGKTIKVGSIRFFPETETRQSKRIYPNELLLLLLRCLVLAVLVLLIAQPILIGKKQQERATVLIDPPVLQDASVMLMLDSILEGDYNIKLLQAGLPEYDPDEIGAAEPLPYWNAIPEIEKLSSDEVMIFAQNKASAFRGKLPSSSKKISWYHIPPKQPASYVLKATRYKEMNHLTIAHFDEGQTRVESSYSSQLSDPGLVESRTVGGVLQFKCRNQADWVPAQDINEYQVLIRYDESFALDAQLWTTAFTALWQTNGIPFSATMSPMATVSNVAADMVIWLSESNISNVNAKTILAYQPDVLSKDLIKRVGNGAEITRRLSLENITSENAAEELLAKFFEDKELMEKLAALDQRALDIGLVEPAYSPIRGVGSKQSQAMPYIYWVFLMALIGLERIVSFRKKQ